MTLGNRADGVDIHRRARIVHRDDRLGPWSDRRFNRFGSNHQVIGIDIDHHRRRAEQADHVQRGDPGLRRGDHFIAGADTQRHQRNVHAAGRRTDGDGVAVAG